MNDGSPAAGEDHDFFLRYGAWEPWTPADVAEQMAGFPGPWWVVGGHAIEAFTGVPRDHEDVDVAIFGRDVGHLRRVLGERHHLWSNHGGTLRPLDGDHPEPLDPLCQVWVREDAAHPWRADFILNPDRDGRWQSRREPDHVADLEDVTWVDGRGIRFLAPEVALFFKTHLHRPKDEVDLGVTWPLLSAPQRAWLVTELRRRRPDHPWTARLVAG
jgi:hypothetical protein